jgi:hypothetical protein
MVFTMRYAPGGMLGFPYVMGLIGACRAARHFRARPNSNFVKLICWIEIKRYTPRKEYRFNQSSA